MLTPLGAWLACIGRVREETGGCGDKSSRGFGSHLVTSACFEGVNLEVHTGQIMFIVGSSGAGKSVLVKHLVGLLRPDRGEIFLDGREISALSEADFYEVRKALRHGLPELDSI